MSEQKRMSDQRIEELEKEVAEKEAELVDLRKVALAMALDETWKIGACITCGELVFPAPALFDGSHDGHEGSIVEATTFNTAVRNAIGVIIKAKASLS